MEKLLGKTLAELQEIAISVGLPRFAGKQLSEWLYQKRVASFEQMTNISLKGRKRLAERYIIGRTLPSAEAISKDGTKKYLFAVSPDKHEHHQATEYIESVYIPDADRATLCVSTQAGCKMACKFCMTGTLGFHGQLTAADILNQIFSIPESQTLTNLVYMGEGEPCDNIDNVLRSLEILTADWGCAWSPSRITVSSVGYMNTLTRLITESGCHIAISLHNPFAKERETIMPIEKPYPIQNVINQLRQYDWNHQRRLSFEYICFGGWNDKIRHTKELCHLLRGLPCRINLIRYHTSGEPSAYPASNEEQMIRMRDYLTQAGFITTIRRSRGEDIFAACGMLVNQLKQQNIYI